MTKQNSNSPEGADEEVAEAERAVRRAQEEKRRAEERLSQAEKTFQGAGIEKRG